MNLVLLHALNNVALDLLAVLGIAYLVLGADDLFVDLMAVLKGCRPRKLDDEALESMQRSPEKRIAIVIAAWKESNVIRHMLLGNIAHLDYRLYDIFIAAYPNDDATVEEVKRVAKLYPHVHLALNRKAGPTSKGQALNQAFGRIRKFERTHGVRFEAFLIHDAEDVIHPKALKLVNRELDAGDFIQIPVFSLGVSPSELVAGTYVDEFAESHTKDLLVRESLGAAVPSAGVGTALSRKLIMELTSTTAGAVFREKALTEDYELGLISHDLGHRSRFSCYYYDHPDTGAREYIATREFFPKSFTRSIRQKTRWTIGIALQGWARLGWPGNLANRYFLLRDRRSLATHILTFLGYPAFIFAAIYGSLVDSGPATDALSVPWVSMVLSANLGLMLNRLFQRSLAVSRVYGATPLLLLPVRWPVAIIINATAGFQAIRQSVASYFSKVAITWAKTEHELPAYFGRTADNVEVVS